jgi:hypothetical protein
MIYKEFLTSIFLKEDYSAFKASSSAVSLISGAETGFSGSG